MPVDIPVGYRKCLPYQGDRDIFYCFTTTTNKMHPFPIMRIKCQALLRPGCIGLEWRRVVRIEGHVYDAVTTHNRPKRQIGQKIF